MEHPSVRLCPAADLNLEKTLTCGQCFRWTKENTEWIGVAGSVPARLWTEAGSIWLQSPDPEPWRDYFDLATDYRALDRRIASAGGYLRQAAAAGRGLRLLRQDPWETLCSFIISQCNNIPRIRKILDKLCRTFGRAIRWQGRIFYAFPEPEVLAAQTPETLTPLRCGYRAAYLLDAAEKIVSGAVPLEKLRDVPTEQARSCLQTIRGVGVKVADCVCLYGLGHRDAFPVDVWIRRVLEEHFPPDFDPGIFGPAAGLAQQYLFYFRREEEKMPRQIAGAEANPKRKN
jgi:N-glycosylase/DNA lyase